MKRLISLICILSICINSNVFAVYLNNNWDMFRGQPCYGLDNTNPSGEAPIIYTEETNKAKQKFYGKNVVNADNFIDTYRSDNWIRCRISQVVFYTNLISDNLYPCGKGFLIKYHYSHDGNDYFLKYDEQEKLFRPYTQEELEQTIKLLNS